jgi:hypothetical protein
MKDGGQAFPHRATYEGYGGVTKEYPKLGMSLRDYFAGQALAGLARNAGGVDAVKERAAKAWAYADAMLAERGKAE